MYCSLVGGGKYELGAVFRAAAGGRKFFSTYHRVGDAQWNLHAPVGLAFSFPVPEMEMN